MTGIVLKTKDGADAEIDPTQVRSLVGLAGELAGHTKLVLDGGNAVTVRGDFATVRTAMRGERSVAMADAALMLSADFQSDGAVLVSCNARTQEPDDYLSVTADGEVLLNRRALSATTDADVLRWAAGAMGRFLATGKRSPVPM